MEWIPVAVLGVLAFLLWRADRRYDHAQQAWAEERAELLDRIQAPEVVVHRRQEFPEPEHVPFDDPLWSEPAISD